MKKEKLIEEVYFLTSNKKKAQDFQAFGLGVKEFHTEIPEVLSPDVEVVVLHKARDTQLNNIVVEDTSLEVEGAEFFGTQIKHVYEKVAEDESFHGKKALWKVSLCMKKDDNFYIATGQAHGILMYPALDTGYHFDRIFAVPFKGHYTQFELLPMEQKVITGARFQALRKLTRALQTHDYSDLKVIAANEVENWNGVYQEENTSKKLKIK